MPNPDQPLRTQVAVITGGGRGIGAAIASRLAHLGAQVVICGRSPKSLEKTTSAIAKRAGRCAAFSCDVADEKSVTALAVSIHKAFSRVDILVNNAGVGAFQSPLHEMDPAEWDRVLNINLRGTYLCIRAFVPKMIEQGGGHIINISSLAGKNALLNGAAYAASKWGLNGLSYSVAEELRSHNIRVAVVCPGSVDTELSPHAGKDKKKMLQPDDVAHAVAMLVTQAPQSFVSEILLRPTQKP